MRLDISDATPHKVQEINRTRRRKISSPSQRTECVCFLTRSFSDIGVLLEPLLPLMPLATMTSMRSTRAFPLIIALLDCMSNHPAGAGFAAARKGRHSPAEAPACLASC
jgi:hypothetical protein